MPNAFPSLHIATAIVLVLFAPGRWFRALSLAFLIGTGLSTLSTGEHYVIDLFPGMLFGCYAAAAGFRQYRKAGGFLIAALSWSLVVRFAYPFLIAHPYVLRSIVLLTAVVVAEQIIRDWRIAPSFSAGDAGYPALPDAAVASEADSL